MAPPPPALMEELVEEILLRFPPNDPASLVRAALVCKPWRRLVSDPGFRRRFRLFHRNPPMLGFLCNVNLNNIGCPRTGSKVPGWTLSLSSGTRSRMIRGNCRRCRGPGMRIFTVGTPRWSAQTVLMTAATTSTAATDPSSLSGCPPCLPASTHRRLMLGVSESQFKNQITLISIGRKVEWEQSRVIEFETLLPAGSKSFHVMAYADGIAVVFVRMLGGIFSFDLNSGQITLVSKYTYRHRRVFDVFPYMSFYTPELEMLPTNDGPRPGALSEDETV
ncbi:hypothetical protein ACP70R_014605 [Stipagrostis hirtigluma subsp. patula]